MSSIRKPKGHQNWVLTYYIDGERQPAISLPTKSKTMADRIQRKIDDLIDCKKAGEKPNSELAKWLLKIPDNLREVLEDRGLIERQIRLTIQSAVAAYIDSKKASWKPKTYNRRLNENKWFVAYFKPETRLETIDRQAAVQFLNWLKDVKNLSPTHINSIMKWGMYIFKYASLCGAYSLPNPFINVRVPNTVQRTKQYISIEYTEKLIEACPTVQWRTAVAMLRYGGMRPEEILLAEWDGVDWGAGTFTFRSPKTEHHEGKGQRTIPLFPRLREAFEEMRMAAEMETGIILPQYILSTEKPGNGWDSKRQSIADGKNGSLCELTDFIVKAKLDNPGSVPTNMRGSCSTDLKRKYPEYAVDAWLGHTRAIARRHYDVVTADLFEQAASADAFNSETPTVRDSVRDCSRFWSLNGNGKNVNNAKNFPQTLENTGFLQKEKSPYNLMQGLKVPPAGLEPVTR